MYNPETLLNRLRSVVVVCHVSTGLAPRQNFWWCALPYDPTWFRALSKAAAEFNSCAHVRAMFANVNGSSAPIIRIAWKNSLPTITQFAKPSTNKRRMAGVSGGLECVR